jgi:hypothetical protein
MGQQACTIFRKKIDDKEEMSFTCTNGVPLGVCHDFLMEMKAWCVDRMVSAHKEHEEQVKQQESIDNGCGDGS